jgi:hypothetical protein
MSGNIWKDALARPAVPSIPIAQNATKNGCYAYTTNVSAIIVEMHKFKIMCHDVSAV